MNCDVLRLCVHSPVTEQLKEVQVSKELTVYLISSFVKSHPFTLAGKPTTTTLLVFTLQLQS